MTAAYGYESWLFMDEWNDTSGHPVIPLPDQLIIKQ